VTCTRLVILVLLIACALCVTGLSNIQRIGANELRWDYLELHKEVGLAGAALPTGG